MTGMFGKFGTVTGIVLVLLGQCGDLSAQGFTYTAPSLMEVSFSGLLGYVPIRGDLDGSYFNAPHFIAQLNTQKPVCYVRNSKPWVSAKFSFACDQSVHQILIRGDVDGTAEVYPAKQVATGPTITYPSTESSQFLPNTIKYYPSYKIDWKASFDDGITWMDAGTSDNKMYVTLEIPKLSGLSSSNPELHTFQTVVHIGCKEGDGLSTIPAMFANVWTYFQTKEVRSVADNELLHYYKSWCTTSVTTESLLQTKDGQCLAWDHLLLDILKVQGFTEPMNYVIAKPNYGSGSNNAKGIYVKTWDFSSNGGTSGNIEFPYLNTWATPYPPHGDAGPYYWTNPEVTDVAPIGGQGNLYPKSRFANHQFIKVLDTYYDPSYGVTYSALSNGEPDVDAAMSGFFRTVDPDFGPDQASTNPPGNQMVFIWDNY